ncbi:MAG: RNA 2',3'-cyclic phosphodiesterase [Clostridia bacterium]|jgi:2'-5' RNA ligase|nr:RNA 2',3'-cyclic phosphodiesterase [Clostridiales bacterium]
MVVFIALELEQGVKGKIYRYVQEVVKPLCRGGRWVDSVNYHLTLKYIGTSGDREVDALYRMLCDVALHHASFRLCTGRVGVFGGVGAGRARVLWLDTSGEVKALRDLRRYIEHKAVGLGFKAENRFTPHITLARDVMLTRKLDRIERLQPISIKINSVSLMESRMEGKKRVYLPLSVHRLS